ncbi:MAG: UpxY family transcription antiterminator [Terracidiphilus sp.]|jgi:transcription antitermination factor NusG
MGEACFSENTQFDTRIARMPLSEYLNPAWYAIQTAYRCEQRVAQDLTMKGFNTYLPLLREVRQWKDRRKIINVPAFTGYLFVHYEPSLRNRVRVLETSGIVRLLGGNHEPSRVSDIEIEAVRRAIGSGVPCDRCDTLTPGALVKVMRGPLSGVEGRLLRMKNGLRLVISISVFSQAISAEVGLNDVETVHDRSLTNYSTQEY